MVRVAILLPLLLLAACGRTWRVQVTVPRIALVDRQVLMPGNLTGQTTEVVQLRTLIAETIRGQSRWHWAESGPGDGRQLRLDLAILRWELLADSTELWRDRQTYDAGPLRRERERLKIREAQAEVLLQVRDVDGKVLLAPLPIRGRACGGRDVPRQVDGYVDPDTEETVMVHRCTLAELVNRAMQAAITEALEVLDGKQPVVWLTLDGSDPDQEAALELAAAGHLDAARERLTAYHRLCPGSASAAFNLARFEEASGGLDAALTLYESACRLAEERADYREAREACRRKVDALAGAGGRDWL